MPTRIFQQIEENGSSCFLRLLEYCSRSVNSLLLMNGVASAGFSVFTLITVNTKLDDVQVLHALSNQLTSVKPLVQTWMYQALVILGAASALGASLGLAATTRKSLWLLTIHMAVLSLVFATEVCAGVFWLSHRDDAVDNQPDTVDVSAFADSERTQRDIATAPEMDVNTLAYIILIAVMSGLQLIALLLACALHSAYTQVGLGIDDECKVQCQSFCILVRHRVLAESVETCP